MTYNSHLGRLKKLCRIDCSRPDNPLTEDSPKLCKVIIASVGTDSLDGLVIKKKPKRNKNSVSFSDDEILVTDIYEEESLNEVYSGKDKPRGYRPGLTYVIAADTQGMITMIGLDMLIQVCPEDPFRLSYQPSEQRNSAGNLLSTDKLIQQLKDMNLDNDSIRIRSPGRLQIHLEGKEVADMAMVKISDRHFIFIVHVCLSTIVLDFDLMQQYFARDNCHITEKK